MNDPVHQVSVNAAAFAALSLPQRNALVNAAIDSIVQRAPDEHRDGIRDLLEHPQPSSALSGSTDPEVARLLGVIQSIRVANDTGAAARVASAVAAAAQEGSTVEVTVALVSSLPTNVRARVIRTPKDGGVPLLLLRSSDASGNDLQLGLEFAAKALKQFGVVPTEEHVTDFHSAGTATQSATNAVAVQIVALLRATTPSDVQGIGTVRAMRVATRIQPSRSRSPSVDIDTGQ